MIVRQQDDGHNRSGTRNRRKRERKYGDVVTRLWRPVRHAGAEDHLHTQEEQDDAPCQLEGDEPHAQPGENHLACDQKPKQHNARVGDGAQCYATSRWTVDVRRDRHEQSVVR